MSDVKYHPNALVISYKTADPTALHAALLQSLTNNIKYCLMTPDKPVQFGEDVVSLVELLQVLLPGEAQLS